VASLWGVRGTELPRRCIRCGQPFCPRCKRTQKSEGREYCMQCFHLFVLGQGLAPASKAAKLYAIERFGRRTLWLRNLGSMLLPGVGHLLRGRTVRGLLLVVLWIAALLALRPQIVGSLMRLARLGSRPEVLLGASGAPFAPDLTLLALLAVPLLPLLWICANLGFRRRKEV
jgi:hypothetical protein